MSRKIGKFLMNSRVKNGLVQMDISKSMGYSTPQFVSLLERGLSMVPVGTLGKLAKAYRVDVRELADLYVAEKIDELDRKVSRYYK